MSQAKLHVKLISHTPNPEMIVAKGGKLCYSPSTIDELEDNLTQENANRFVNTLVSMGHESPVEHVSFTFAIEGVSRSLTHQLVRHRLASYSQQSQRYVRLNQFEYIIPKEIEQIPEAKKEFVKAMEEDQEHYDRLVESLMVSYICKYCSENNLNDFLLNSYNLSDFKKINSKQYNEFEKKAIENARYVFPNACETKIIVTMNVRTLLNFFSHRCCNRASDEIRDLADEMLKLVKKVAPTLFKKAGATCTYGQCHEGKMSCGNPRK